MILAFVACICWALAIFPVTEAISRIGYNSVNFYRHCIAFVVLGFIVYIIQPDFITHIFTIGWYNLIIIFVSGILGLVVSDVLRLRALNKLGIKTVSVFSACQPALGLILGWAFLNEKQNLLGFLGILMTVIGLLLFTHFNYQSSHNKLKYKELFLLLLCMLAQGISLVFSKVALIKTFDILKPYEVAYVRIIGAVCCMVVIAFFSKKLVLWMKDLIKNKNDANKYFFLSTFLGNITAVCCSLYALSVLSSVLAQSIFSLAPFLILPINSIVRKEKMQLKQIIAFIISITGVYAILWQKELELFLYK